MPTIMIALGVVIIGLLVFVIYAAYQWSIQERNDMDEDLTPDEEKGVREAYKSEKEKLKEVEAWREKTFDVYHVQLTSSEVLDTYLGEPTEEALKENLNRAKKAVREHQERLDQLRSYAREHNIDLGDDEEEEKEEEEGSEEES
jgi:Tfp pilus assembly protein PilO